MKTKKTEPVKAQREVEILYSSYQKKDLYPNPNYQRYNNAWNVKQKSDLIEAMLEGCPIGEMIINKTKGYKYEIVDGLQRITAITEFINNGFSLAPKTSSDLVGLYRSKFNKLFTDKLDSGVSFRLKYRNLPEDLQKYILNFTVSVAKIEDWTDDEIVRYFQRLQSGKPLSNPDKLYTVQTPLATIIKALSSDQNYLHHLNLVFDNKNKNKGHDRMIYKAALEAIYCKLGYSIGSPSKLQDYFNDLPSSPEQNQYVDRLKEFLDSLTSADRELFQSTGMNTDLKLIFCLVLFGNFGDMKEAKDFIIRVVKVSSVVKVAMNKGDLDTNEDLIADLNKYGLNIMWSNSVWREHIKGLAKLRVQSHNSQKVEEVCMKMTEIFNNTRVKELV